MIAMLRGRLARRSLEGIVIDVGGVGYLVMVSTNTHHQLPVVGEEVSLDIYTHVREDALNLYGFGLPGEEAIYHRLVNVSGIGPRLAMGILSGISPRDLVTAILEGQPKRLQVVTGVGKRLAERIVVDLKDKLAKSPIDFGDGQAPLVPSSFGGSPLEEDLTEALAGLGYNKTEISRVIGRLPMQDPDVSLQVLIRGALRLLSRSG